MNVFLELSRAIALLAPLQRDPRVALLSPGPGAGHIARRFTLESPAGPVPVMWLEPVLGTGATVVYAHGGGTADILPSAPLFEALLRRGIGVVSFDFPGFGAHPADLTFPAVLECLPTVLAAVRAGVGEAPVGLYGLSLGGVLALHAALAAPWLRALALFGPPLSLAITDRHRFQELAGTFHPLAGAVLVDAPSGHVAKTFFEPVRFAPDAHHILFDPPFAVHVDRLIGQLDPLGTALQVPALPTLILGGAWDAAAPPADLQRLADRLAGPVHLEVFPHRTHTTLLYDRRAAEWTADWLADRLRPGSGPTG